MAGLTLLLVLILTLIAATDPPDMMVNFFGTILKLVRLGFCGGIFGEQNGVDATDMTQACHMSK